MQISSGLYERKGLGFDKRFIDLMSFKAKYGHCNVSQNCEDASLGRWCCKLRGPYKKMHNNQKPFVSCLGERRLDVIISFG